MSESEMSINNIATVTSFIEKFTIIMKWCSYNNKCQLAYTYAVHVHSTWY